MGHYGADSQKPQRGWSNNANYAILDRGAWSRKVLPQPKVINVKKTINKETGKVSYSGTPQLKQSQPWAQLISHCMFFIKNQETAMWFTLGIPYLSLVASTKGLSSTFCGSNPGSSSKTSPWWRETWTKGLQAWGCLEVFWNVAMVHLGWC